MAVISLLSRFKQPVNRNRKVLGVYTVAVIIIGLLGFVYFQKIDAAEADLNHYKLNAINQLYEQSERIFENNRLREEAQNDPLADSVWTDPDLAAVFDQVGWSRHFEELVVLKDSQVIYQSINGALNPKRLHLFDSTFFHSAGIESINLQERQHYAYARRFNYPGKLDAKIKGEFTFIGFIPVSTVTNQTHRLDAWLVTLLFVILVIILFGLPYFKLVFIGEDERLHNRDVLLAGGALVVGSPVVVILFLSLFTHGMSYLSEIPRELDGLAREIETRFSEENAAIVGQLEQLDLQALKDKNPTPLPKDSARKEGLAPVDTSATSSMYHPVYNFGHQGYANFKFLSRVSTSGEVAYHLNFFKTPTRETQQIKDRQYLKDWEANQGKWYLPSQKDKKGEDVAYLMQPVISIEDNREEAVYVFPVDGHKDSLTIASIQLQSVHHPTFPFGYQFTIIDPEGNTWFHSKPGRSTFENFFEVSKQNSFVRGAVHKHIDAQGSLNYHGRRQLYQVRPIPNTTLSVIVMYEVGFLRLQEAETLTLSSVPVTFAFLFAVLMAVMLSYRRVPRFDFLRYKSFSMDFLVARKRNRLRYLVLSLSYTGLGLVGIVICAFADVRPTFALFAALLVIFWSYLFVHVTLLSKGHFRLKRFGLTEIIVLVMALALNVPGFIYLELWESIVMVVGQLLVFGLIFAINPGMRIAFGSHHRLHTMDHPVSKPSRSMRFLRWMVKIVPWNHYRYWYVSFFFTWMAFGALLPAHIFFFKANHLETKVWTKHTQFDLAEQYLHKHDSLSRHCDPLWLDKAEEKQAFRNDLLRKGEYLETGFDPLHIHPVSQPALVEGDSSKSPREILNRWLWEVRPAYAPVALQVQPMFFKRAMDGFWVSNKKQMTIEVNYLGNNGKDTVVKSAVQLDKVKGNWGGLAIAGWALVFMGLLWAFFYTISFYVSRWHGFRFEHFRANNYMADETGRYAEKLGRLFRGRPGFSSVLDGRQFERNNSGLVLVGPSYSSRRKFGFDILFNSGFEGFVHLSFLELFSADGDSENTDNWKDKLEKMEINGELAETGAEPQAYIIEHLEYGYLSEEKNHAKLQVIQYLVAHTKHVIILSEVHPNQILQFYRGLISLKEEDAPKLNAEFAAWRNILGDFPTVIMGFNREGEKVDEELRLLEASWARSDGQPAPRLSLRAKRFLIKELGHGNFLPALTQVLTRRNIEGENPDPGQVVEIDQKKLIIHAQHTAEGYYHDIWNSLSSRERYLLYDMADDEFINIKDGDTLIMLIKKGLVVWRDKPAIFNLSFRNYILSSAEIGEALKLEEDRRERGTWGIVKIVLYLMILTLVVFLVLGEPEIVSDFNGLVAPLAGVVGIFSALGGLFSGGSQG